MFKIINGKKGWVDQKLQSSKSIKIYTAGFKLTPDENNELEAKYYIGIKFNKNLTGKYIIVDFQNPKDEMEFFRRIIYISKERKFLETESNKIYGLKSRKGYLIKISISKDKSGKNIEESLDQYVRTIYSSNTYKN